MRISKLPEERRQEIMDTAMQVFVEKGYEQTTMRDIATAVGVVPGLCYRYFKSKQELFDCAFEQYVTFCCEPVIALLKSDRSMEELLTEYSLLHTVHEDKEHYGSFFHQSQNKNFHILLSNAICEYILPYFIPVIEQLSSKYQITLSDSRAFSRFFLHGMTAILTDEVLTNAQKQKQINEYVHQFMS